MIPVAKWVEMSVLGLIFFFLGRNGYKILFKSMHSNILYCISRECLAFTKYRPLNRNAYNQAKKRYIVFKLKKDHQQQHVCLDVDFSMHSPEC